MTHKFITHPLHRQAMAAALWQARKLRAESKAEFLAMCWGIETGIWELVKLEAALWL